MCLCVCRFAVERMQCRMLDVANKKLKLEKMVIERGGFSVKEKGKGAVPPPAALTGEDLEALLRPKQTQHQENVQSADISDENLELLLDRTDMLPAAHPTARPEDAKVAVGPKLPPAGPGWEVVASTAAQRSLLSAIG